MKTKNSVFFFFCFFAESRQLGFTCQNRLSELLQQENFQKEGGAERCPFVEMLTIQKQIGMVTYIQDNHTLQNDAENAVGTSGFSL